MTLNDFVILWVAATVAFTFACIAHACYFFKAADRIPPRRRYQHERWWKVWNDDE